MTHCYFVKLNNKEWMFIEALEHSSSLSQIARYTGLPYITIYRIYRKLKMKYEFNFIMNFKKMNLLPLYLLFDENQEINRINRLTVSIRKIYGKKAYKMVYALVPFAYKEKYLKSFDETPLLVIQGLEFLSWRPNSGSNIYFPSEKIILPVFNFWIDKFDVVSKPVCNWNSSYDSPDYIDIAILLWKYNYLFEPVTSIIRWVRRYDPHFPILSKQVLSYHYRKHVLKYWLYNSISMYFDATCVPFRFFYFEGPESHIVARILVNLPSFYRALIDKNKALVFGQPPGHMFENIYKIISTFDVDMPLGDLIMSLENIGRFIPPLWKFVENNRWVWRDLTIKIPAR